MTLSFDKMNLNIRVPDGVKGRQCRFHGAPSIAKQNIDKIMPYIRVPDGSRVCDPRRVWDGVPRINQSSGTHLLSVIERVTLVSPPKVAFQFAPAFGGLIKLDGTLPHLRAAAGVFADALADGMRFYRLG